MKAKTNQWKIATITLIIIVIFLVILNIYIQRNYYVFEKQGITIRKDVFDSMDQEHDGNPFILCSFETKKCVPFNLET